ncbi:YhgE/Pip family protein, partial [Paenibacillus sp. D51F]
GPYGDAGGVLAAAGKRLGGLERSLARQAELARAAGEALAAGRQPAAGLAEQLRQGAEEAGRIAADLLGRYDSELAPRVAAGVKAAQKAAAEAGDALKRAHAELPAVTGLLRDAAKGIAFGQSKLDAFQSELPEAEKRIRDLAAKLRELRKKGNLGEAIDLLKSNYVQKAEFLARPIKLKQHSLFPIANYGTAMTPFFTVLSLWVGALLLVSMLSLDVHREAAVQHAYLGRFLTFWAIGLLQSLLVTLGDILLLGVRPASPVLFVLSALLISTVFMLIVYTLVSVLGNVGKAAAIVLLVLQLAGSGGTFPVQVTAPIFRALYPFLPFTYAVGLMRETVGGILPEAARRDLSKLLLFGVIALLAGLLLKKPLGRAAGSLAAKARESGIIH